MKKVVVIILFLLVSVVTLAQNSYRFEIRQVLPKKNSLYSNAFNFKREMENAISSQTNKLNGNCNYQIFIMTPSGEEVRNIQNINWIQIVNGIKSYHKKQTLPNSNYDEATIWEGFSCNIDGSRKGELKKVEFLYRVTLADTAKAFETAFVDEKTAEAEAMRLFDENAKDDRLVSVVVYRFENGKAKEYDRKTNKEQYDAYVEHDKNKKGKEKQQIVEQQQVEQFVADMAFVHANRDSLKIVGVHFCREALEKGSLISDSLFASQKLDSVYVSVLLEDVLPENDKKAKKARKKVQPEIETITKKSYHTRNELYVCSKKIENILSEKKKWYQFF